MTTTTTVLPVKNAACYLNAYKNVTLTTGTGIEHLNSQDDYDSLHNRYYKCTTVLQCVQ